MDFKKIEAKWQKKWADAKIGTPSFDKKKKFFIIFAYPGISGYLHIGHMRGYNYVDMIARYKKMTGYDVFFPVGTHATGNVAIGFAKKVQKKDESWLNYLKVNGFNGSLKDMEDPKKVVDYFNSEYVKNWKRFGFISDWNSFTCTIFPDYSKFIDWQFKKLKEAGMITQKDYFATACENCGPVAVDPSETDISKGGNAEKQEYTALKFKLGNEYLIAATLRPETVFGQTNLWIDPKQEYTKVKVGSETWIMSAEAAEKIKFQKDNTKIVGKIKGSEMIDKKVTAPMIHKQIPILPSRFCDPTIGTGIVTSVPSDAPHDYMGLVDLWKEGKYKDVKPIPIISTQKYGDSAAEKICKELKIQNQTDSKLEEAKKEVYKEGFHTGTMNKNCGKYSGMRVSEAKEQIDEQMKKSGEADVFHDLSEEVVCRCGGKVFVKKIENAWFIDYGNKIVKEKAKQHAKNMNIMPQEYADNINNVIDWFRERACARLGNWLGTPLVFDPKWTIEAISDSTLYPAYYIVSRHVNSKELKPADLTDEFFDYIYLGKGKPKNKLWEQIRKEFDYIYPVDINLGGKEHQTVHFPPYIMNHIAILPKEKWPKGILVNWYVVQEGGKISKSKGGASTTPNGAANMFTVDGMRLYYSHVGTPFNDIVWKDETVNVYKANLERFVKTIEKSKGSTKESKSDKILLSKFNSKLKIFRENFENYDLRKGLTVLFFEFMNDFDKYQENVSNKTLKEIKKLWLRALTPIIPHTCEELWEQLGEKTLISLQQIPEVDEKVIDVKLEREFELFENVKSDIKTVIELTKLSPKRITLIVAPEWKRKVLKQLEGITNPGELMKKAMQDSDVKKNGKNAAKFIQYVANHSGEFQNLISEKEEFDILKSFKQQIIDEFKADLEISAYCSSQNPSKDKAVPMKPAIFIE